MLAFLYVSNVSKVLRIMDAKSATDSVLWVRGACERGSPILSLGSRLCGMLFVATISEWRNAYGWHYRCSAAPRNTVAE
jgi:hypothetical protein